MTLSIYATEDGSLHGGGPLLIVTRGSLPPHPDGEVWRWVMTSSELPEDTLIGRRLLQRLAKQGHVITPLTLERLLRVRIPAVPSINSPTV